MFCKNLLQITPGGTIELDSFQEDEDKNKAIILEALLSTIDQQHLQDLRSPERLFNKNMTIDLNSRNPGLKRWIQFLILVNNSHHFFQIWGIWARPQYLPCRSKQRSSKPKVNPYHINIHCRCFCGPIIKGLKIGAKYGRIYSGGGWKLGRLGSLYCMGLRGGEKFCMEDLQRRFLKDNTDIINAIINISIIIFMFYAQLSASPQLHQKKSRNGENIRKSPPSKKTKKTNLDFSSDSPSYRWTDPLAEIWMH